MADHRQQMKLILAFQHTDEIGNDTYEISFAPMNDSSPVSLEGQSIVVDDRTGEIIFLHVKNSWLTISKLLDGCRWLWRAMMCQKGNKPRLYFLDSAHTNIDIGWLIWPWKSTNLLLWKLHQKSRRWPRVGFEAPRLTKTILPIRYQFLYGLSCG